MTICFSKNKIKYKIAYRIKSKESEYFFKLLLTILNYENLKKMS